MKKKYDIDHVIVATCNGASLAAVIIIPSIITALLLAINLGILRYTFSDWEDK